MKKNIGRRQMIWDIIYPAVWLLLCMLVVTMAMIAVVGSVTHIYDPNALVNQISWFSLAVSAVYCAAALFFLKKQLLLDNLRFGCLHGDMPPALQAAAVIGTAVFSQLWSLVLNAQWINDLFPGYRRGALQAFTGQNPILLILVTVILSPAAEELVFRGLVYRRAAHHLGVPAGVILSALLFGLYHGNMIQFLFAGVLGIAFALLYEKSGSLKTVTIAHMLFNLLSVLLADWLRLYG